jgi:hypothetical protein
MTCSRNEQCAPGLVCSDGSGTFGSGVCTAACAFDSECEALSPGTECLESVGLCVDACVDTNDCPTDWLCTRTNELRNSYGYCRL